MRDPNRIPPVLDALGAIWKKYPDLRFGQLIGNIIGSPDMLFHIEDDALMLAIKKIEDRLKK